MNFLCRDEVDAKLRYIKTILTNYFLQNNIEKRICMFSIFFCGYRVKFEQKFDMESATSMFLHYLFTVLKSKEKILAHIEAPKTQVAKFVDSTTKSLRFRKFCESLNK